MMLIKTKQFLFLFFVTMIALGSIGVYGYHLINNSSGMDAHGLKLNAENFLFIMLNLSLLLILIFLFLLFRNLRLNRELDKLIELNKYQSFSPETNMKRLGKIGEKITVLYHQLNQLNEKKSLKISALGELVTLLMNNISLPMVVTDITGRILYASKIPKENISLEKVEMLEKPIGLVLPQVNIEHVAFELDKGHGAIQEEGDGAPYTCYPIYNSKNEAQYIAFILGKIELLTKIQRVLPKAKTPRGLKLKTMLSRFLLPPKKK